MNSMISDDSSAPRTMKKGNTMPDATSSLVDASEKDFELTPFQRQIIALTVAGYSIQESAKKLGISVQAAKRHLSRVCDKLHLSNPLELVLHALHYQLVNDD